MGTWPLGLTYVGRPGVDTFERDELATLILRAVNYAEIAGRHMSDHTIPFNDGFDASERAANAIHEVWRALYGLRIVPADRLTDPQARFTPIPPQQRQDGTEPV